MQPPSPSSTSPPRIKLDTFLPSKSNLLPNPKQGIQSNPKSTNPIQSNPPSMATTTTAIIGEEHCEAAERELTVHKTSLFSPGDGFAVYDHRTGALAFRVDTYNRPGGAIIAAAPAAELCLLGPSGAAILTVRRKFPSLHHRWEAFLGDGFQKPLFTARRSSIIGGSHGAVLVDVCGGEQYRVEGSFSRRCCRVAAASGDRVEVVAEVRRKVDESKQVVMGKDVFSLWIAAGFDAAFVMGIVLVLDRICSGDDDDLDLDMNLGSAVAAVNGGVNVATAGEAVVVDSSA